MRLVSSSNFEDFFDTFLDTLSEHAPLTKKKYRYNCQVFISKMLRKAIIKRYKLRNTFNRKRYSKNWQNYKQQSNICSNILKSSKKKLIETRNINEITDNRKFWKTTNNIILTEKNETLIDNRKFSTPLTSILQILPKA